MRYINASVVLPEELVEQLQDLSKANTSIYQPEKMNLKFGESCRAHEKRLTKEMMLLWMRIYPALQSRNCQNHSFYQPTLSEK